MCRNEQFFHSRKQHRVSELRLEFNHTPDSCSVFSFSQLFFAFSESDKAQAEISRRGLIAKSPKNNAENRLRGSRLTSWRISCGMIQAKIAVWHGKAIFFRNKRSSRIFPASQSQSSTRNWTVISKSHQRKHRLHSDIFESSFFPPFQTKINITRRLVSRHLEAKCRLPARVCFDKSNVIQVDENKW